MLNARDDPSFVNLVRAHVREAEAFEVPPLLLAVRANAHVDHVLHADVVRDSAGRAGVRPPIVQIRVPEVEGGGDPEHTDVLRERSHDGGGEAVFPADHDGDLPRADDVGGHLADARNHVRRRPEGRCVPQIREGNVREVPFVVHHEALEIVRGLADCRRPVPGAAPEGTRAVIRDSEEDHPGLLVLRHRVREPRGGHVLSTRAWTIRFQPCAQRLDSFRRPRASRYIVSWPGARFSWGSAGTVSPNVWYVSMSMSCATFAWMERTWAFLLSIIGTRTLCVTGWTMDRFCSSNRPTASSRAFASPCFPGFEVWMLRIRQGSSSMTMYRLTLSSRISACSHDMGTGPPIRAVP